MQIRATTSQSQQQILAPTMQQSIEVLLLPLMDLATAIEQQLQDNPMLETEEETSPSIQQMTEEIHRRLEKIYHSQDNPQHHQEMADDEGMDEKPIKKEDSLEEILLRQLRTEFSDALLVKIGEMIIGNINEDGYLTTTCEEIAQILDTTPEKVEDVLRTVQTFEPLGIASRDLRECLLVQARERLNGDSEIACRLIDSCLEELGHKKFQVIARKLSISLEEVKQACRLVASLDPKPARNFWPHSPHIYIKPDIFITKDDHAGYQLYLNNEGLPRLRINPIYKNMLKDKRLTPEDREFIHEKLKNAMHFIKSVEQRGVTVKRIAQYILDNQKEFFEQGHMALRPMTLKDIAQAIGRNESTISRAINNKYMETPQGLLPMKFFFSQAMGHGNGTIPGTSTPSPSADSAPASVLTNEVCSRSIKEEIIRLISGEDKAHPLSDQDIQKYFEAHGMQIARRTVSKYRQALNFLPAHLRKE